MMGYCEGAQRAFLSRRSIMRRTFSMRFSVGVVILSITCLAIAADKTAKPQDKTVAGEAAADAGEHVRLALLAESVGDNEQRSARLTEALEADNSLPAAHWHSGQVKLGSEWLSLATAETRAKVDL